MKLKIPTSIWILGFVSLFMDISSEMIHSLLPTFMVSELAAGALAIGLVEGIAESAALIVKVFSGALSDFYGRRKNWAVLGYSLGAFSKPLFAVAGSVNAVLTARFIDRIGKGLRGAPRDALVADFTPEPIRGTAYGLRQSLDTVGAFMGPLLAMGLLALWPGNFRAVFGWAVIPGFFSVALLLWGIHEPEASRPQTTLKNPIHWTLLKKMGRDYWWVVAVGAVFTLARFSEAFLILRARQTGLPDGLSPLVFIVMNVVYSLTAYPAGRLADRVNRHRLLAGGLIILIVADLVLARSHGLGLSLLGISLWGLHMGLTQGLLSTMVAAAAPDDLRGTGFGFFNLASGGAMLIASALAGLLWDKMGSSSTFFVGAAFSAGALILLWLTPNRKATFSSK